MESAMFIFWIILAIALIVLDLCTSAFLFSWFAVGAICAVIAESFGVSVIIQIIIFFIVSLILMIIGYPIVKKSIKKKVKRTPLMEETYIGRIMTAEEEIRESTKIKLGGNYWTAQNVGNTINKNQNFQIVGIKGNKMMIKGL